MNTKDNKSSEADKHQTSSGTGANNTPSPASMYYSSSSGHGAALYGPSTYYSSQQSGVQYYGGGQYYGGSQYAGGPQYYGSNGEDLDEGNSFLGPMSITRVFRVIGQKWPTLVVAVLLGLGAGFAYYKASPVVYRATSIVQMTAVAPKYVKTEDAEINSAAQQASLDEIINTRLAQLKGLNVVKRVAERVRADYPSLKMMSDADLYDLLIKSVNFNSQRRSLLVEISAKHNNAEIAQSIANAYAETAHIYSIDQTRESADASVEWLRAQCEVCRRAMEEANDAILKYRIDNQLDVLMNKKESLRITHDHIVQELTSLETECLRIEDLLSILKVIREDPEQINLLPETVPNAHQIGQVQSEMTSALTEYNLLRKDFSDEFPSVKEARQKYDILTRQFALAVNGACDTANANLALWRKQAKSLEELCRKNEEEAIALDVQISETESRLTHLDNEAKLANENYQMIVKRMEEVRLGSQDTHATIRVIEEAQLPEIPVSPDPRIAFSAGPVLGLAVGFFLILVLDRIEDKITSAEDIEKHMKTSVLALLPHVPRITRNELVKLSYEKKFSRFSEAFAGLRSLLESPRFADLSKVTLMVSTMPEEGKTITASNLAVSYGMAGRKTLLVDFDLRRPRIGRMFGVSDSITEKNSLIDVLNRAIYEEFDTLPLQSGCPNLDIICSKATNSISPASVMGSDFLAKFFVWARAHYERIVIDSAPFGLVSDALSLSSLVDSCIVVCRPERSRYGVIRHAIRSLAESGARIIGVVVNDVYFGRTGTFSYGNYGSYGYGHYGSSHSGRYGYGSYRHSASDDDDSITVGSHEDDDEEEVKNGKSDKKSEDENILDEDEE